MAQKACTTCHAIGYPSTAGGPSFILFVVLTFFFVVPGIIYLVWALTSRREACGKCGAATLVPLDSPAGRQIVGGGV